MTPRSPGAFMLSAFFHAGIIALVVFFAIVNDQTAKETPHVLELVAGEGDNYGATAAPKLGTPNGVKLDLPPAPVREPDPQPAPEPDPEPAKPEPSPITPAPTPPPPQPKPPQPKPTPSPVKPAPNATPAQPTVSNFKKTIQRKIWAADWKAKQEIKKERAAEAKRLREEAERERQARAAAAARSASSTKYSKIDAEGIAKGVLGGSAENKTGGAGGKALSRAEGELLDAYYAMLKQRVLAAIDKPAGVSDELATTVAFTIQANGRLTNAHVIQSSGSDELDRAVVAAFLRVEMPPHPQHHSEEAELTFKTKDIGG